MNIPSNITVEEILMIKEAEGIEFHLLAEKPVELIEENMKTVTEKPFQNIFIGGVS